MVEDTYKVELNYVGYNQFLITIHIHKNGVACSLAYFLVELVPDDGLSWKEFL
jgi:hypothetical protein